MTQREAIERFHLVFLRHFAPVVSTGTVCLKGGVNLRLYHNSPRLSEDIVRRSMPSQLAPKFRPAMCSIYTIWRGFVRLVKERRPNSSFGQSSKSL